MIKEDEVIIKVSDYIQLLGDRALLKELEREGVMELPLYDKAVLSTFLSTSRRYDDENEEVTRLTETAKKGAFGQTT